MTDQDILAALNRDYVNSVQYSDVARFDAILAEDFYCSNPDKSLVDRTDFLKQTAKPVTIRDLAAHDVNIRIMGDFAIIHARTSYTLPERQRGLRPLHRRMGQAQWTMAGGVRARVTLTRGKERRLQVALAHSHARVQGRRQSSGVEPRDRGAPAIGDWRPACSGWSSPDRFWPAPSWQLP